MKLPSFFRFIGERKREKGKTDEAFSQIADKMGVSKTALAIRMKQLDLVDRNDLNNPYSLIDICCDETDR